MSPHTKCRIFQQLNLLTCTYRDKATNFNINLNGEKMFNKLSFAILTILIILSLTACEKDEDAGKIGEMAEIKETEPFSSPFSGKSDWFSTESTENKISYAYNGNKIPEYFPKELPVYSPAIVNSCRILENNKGAIAVLQTMDSPDKIAEFYLNSAKENDWTIEDKLLTEKMFFLLVKNNSSSINISATEGIKDTTITLAISLNTN
jgi:hypothetical protein